MSDWLASMAFESAFEPPRDCRIRGDVSCRVVDSRCEIIDIWCDRVTIKVVLRLRLTIRSGGLACRFERRVVIKETVWCNPDALIVGCKVTAAICRCRLRKGLVICVGAVQVRIQIRRPEPFCPCPCPSPCPPPRACCIPDWSSGCGSDWPSDWPSDCNSDWSTDCVSDCSGSQQDCLSESTSACDSDCSSDYAPRATTPTRRQKPQRRRSRHC